MASASNEREFQYSAADFEVVRKLLYKKAGINFFNNHHYLLLIIFYSIIKNYLTVNIKNIYFR